MSSVPSYVSGTSDQPLLYRSAAGVGPDTGLRPDAKPDAGAWPDPDEPVNIAVIRLRERMVCTEQEIVEYCRGQIAHFKVPRFVRFVDAFPMTVTGKVQKYLIREQQVRELNAATGSGS